MVKILKVITISTSLKFKIVFFPLRKHTLFYCFYLIDSKYLLIHQAVLLLQFLEDLEKLMYNAYEGTANSLPPCVRVCEITFYLFYLFFNSCQQVLALSGYSQSQPYPSFYSQSEHSKWNFFT